MAVRKSLASVKKQFATNVEKAGEYWLNRQEADMGNYAGIVPVPGTPNMVYVRLSNGQVVKVFNDSAPNIYNWKVYVGYDKAQPGLLKVTDVRWVYNVTNSIAYVLFHHGQHEFPGPDTVWVRRDQFLPLLVLPLGGFHVILYGDVIYTSHMTYPIRVENQDNIDLSAHIMTSGAKYVLMEITSSGAINYVIGDTYGSIDILRSSAPFPAPSDDAFPVCVIEFYEGQTEIRRDSTERNIIDLRMFTSNATAGAGQQWHTAPSLTVPATLDEFGIWDVDVGLLKKITWGDMNLQLKAYFDTIYTPVGHEHTGGELVMESGVSNPPVPLETSDGTDWLYSS